MGRLKGKVASVLGAAGEDNMGQVIARRFAAEGATVVVSGRNESSLKKIASEIGGDYILCDITRKSDISQMVDGIVDKYGRIDIALNATGWGLLVPLTEHSEDDLDKIINLQFKGPFLWSQALVNAMSRHGGGSIIQISSATATIMLDNHASYMGTKAGFDHVIRTIANEYGEQGIRANSISPGLTQSPMTQDAMQSAALVEEFRQCYPLGRIGTSDDIAAAAVFLASDECFMTGENLQVNGGLCLRRNPRAHEMTDAIRRAGEIS